jgi:hypothetical protein
MSEEHEDDYVDHLQDDEYEGVVAWFAFHPEEIPEGSTPLEDFDEHHGLTQALARAASSEFE